MSRAGGGFDRVEFRYRMFHRRQDLIGENTLPQQEFDALVASINEYVGESDARLRALCRKYPATVSVFLVHCSLYGYARVTANFWSGVWERLVIGQTQARQQLLGNTFLKYVRSAGLARVDTVRRRYVGQILLHTPIPLSCMTGFFGDVVQVLAEQSDVTVDDLGDLLEPIQQFIDAGDRVADNLISRSVELYEFLRRKGRPAAIATGNNDEAERAIDSLAEEFNLPRLVVRHMIEWFPRRATEEGSRRRMRLRFDPYDVGVVLELRQHEGRRVNVGNQVTVRADGTDYPADFHGRAATWSTSGTITIPAPAPAEKYEVYFSDADHPLGARGIEADRPIYFAPRTGSRLGHGPLPADDVWVLAPKGWTVRGVSGDDAELDGASVVVEQLPPLYGHWRRFQALGLNTKGYKYLRWHDEADAALPAHDRAIEWHDDTLPKLVDGGLWAPWLTPANFPPVYLDRAPHVWLPISENDTDEKDRWSIRCLQAGKSGHELFHVSLSDVEDSLVHRDGGVVLDLEAPHLLGRAFGSFHIAVHGPLGLDAHFDLTLVRGVAIRVPQSPSEPGIIQVRVSDADQAPHELHVFAPSTEIEQSREGEKQWVVHPASGTTEFVLNLLPLGLSGGSETLGPHIVATIPIRLQPAEWQVLELDPAASRRRAESADELSAGGVEPIGDTSQPALLQIDSVDDLAGKAIAFRSFLTGGCRHEFVLYADGQPVQRVPGKFRENSPQRFRVDLSQFGETIRAHSGAEFELQATCVLPGHASPTHASPTHEWQRVASPGDRLTFTVARIQFDWQVRDLTASLVPLEDGSDNYFFDATWSEVCTPRTPRQLVLEDRWRNRTAVELPIDDYATQVQAVIPSDALPPGRYTVAFTSRGGWRRAARRPGRVLPETVLEVGRAAWRGILNNPQDRETWLLALNAHADGVWRAPETVPEPGEWTMNQLAVLGRTLVHAADTLDGRVGHKLRRWSLEQRLRLVGAGAGVGAGVGMDGGSGRRAGAGASTGMGSRSDVGGGAGTAVGVRAGAGAETSGAWTKAELQVLSVLLGLPRTFTPDTQERVRREIFESWPTALALAGLEALPLATRDKLKYSWGYLYTMQEPAAAPAHDGDETTFFDPNRPAVLLGRCLKGPQRRVIRHRERDLEHARRTLSQSLPKVAKLLPRVSGALGRAFRRSQGWLFDTFKIPGHNLSLPAKLAFVCASVALLQRTAARAPEFHGVFDQFGHDDFELLCTLCPDLYDYYLLLAEASLRHLAAEEVA